MFERGMTSDRPAWCSHAAPPTRLATAQPAITAAGPPSPRACGTSTPFAPRTPGRPTLALSPPRARSPATQMARPPTAPPRAPQRAQHSQHQPYGCIPRTVYDVYDIPDSQDPYRLPASSAPNSFTAYVPPQPRQWPM
eukprot:NODE_3728_length_1169_cov_154.789675_g3543_i0.p2 GENE.NODE_3728_length_1169_cov_154.789675_g3543_i0~~NODE_3728_length_1169_cov_154.789675_g3543_i0.p2  ORF type:complete len:138 (+),score=18.57 NODE_3728_length_1169_cov_154.789675_g3543_i0:599-1012(+)